MSDLAEKTCENCANASFLDTACFECAFIDKNGGKRFSLWKSGGSYENDCGKMLDEWEWEYSVKVIENY